MIKGILLFGIALILWSCQKNDNPENTQSPKLKSVSIYKTFLHIRTRITDSIVYDSRNRLVECRRIFFDTASINISSHQTNYLFNYPGSDTLPSSYGETNSFGDTYHHGLTYNNLNHLVRDSAYLPHIRSIYFFYAPNVIVTKGASTVSSHDRIDSFILQNGNIASHYYIFPRDNTSNSVDQMTYSNYLNPLYNSNGLGVLLYSIFQPDFDWISRYLFTSITNSRNLGNISIDWRTDGNGKVNSGSGSFSNGTTIQITFDYN
jgi:hypothetical protein